MARLYLLDGTYELFRAYFGAPRRASADGREVGAVVGIIASTLALLREHEPEYVAAATDHVIRSFRNELYPGYKTEEGVDPELLTQFELAEEALRAIGVTVWPMVEVEADDALATGAERFAGEVDQVVLASPDKDLAQCVRNDRVVTLDRRSGAFIDAEGVREKFGVAPASIPDYLALVGDSADGFPGLPGWGAKSAAALLARYGHIEAIPLDEAEWDVPVRGAARLAAALRAGAGDAALFRTLATLRLDAPVSERLADLEWEGVPYERFLALCDELGANDLRDRPHRWTE